MITFYPGPSKVYAEVPYYVQEAYDAGVLSINHRSPEFMEIFQRVTLLISKKLDIPPDYTLVFTSSATECWEVISQSLVREQSFHVYNGAFGEKWLRYAKKLVPSVDHLVFNREELPDISRNQVSEADLIALTHNETSNGTALPTEWMKATRQEFSEVLIAVDATSSMAGVELPWEVADVWFASVQKCFGLPAGLAVMVLSPRAVNQAHSIGEKGHYNSLTSILEQTQKFQTTHTPNVLGLYLLMRVLEQRAPISEISDQTYERYREWINMLQNSSYVKLLVYSEKVRSKTVVPFQAAPKVINQIRDAAKQRGITLGNGYGDLQPTTLRLANFPAISDDEIHQLREFFTNFVPEKSSLQ